MANLTQLKDSAVGVFKGLGALWSIAIIAFLLIAGWFVLSYAIEGYYSSRADKQIEAFKKQADDAERRAAQALSERDSALGAAAVYKQQADILENERTQLLLMRPDLQKKIIETGKAIEEIRNRPLHPIDDNMQSRIDELGQKLNQLYP